MIFGLISLTGLWTNTDLKLRARAREGRTVFVQSSVFKAAYEQTCEIECGTKQVCFAIQIKDKHIEPKVSLKRKDVKMTQAVFSFLRRMV